MPRPKVPAEAAESSPLPYPFGGVGQDDAFAKQPGGTTPDGVNVRAYDQIDDRRRGGSRPGTVKFRADPPHPA